MNVIVSGDCWQFGPIGSPGAVFDNPLGFRKASQKQIAEMFWQKYSEDTPNAFTDFKELTVERRCKDEWLAFFITKDR